MSDTVLIALIGAVVSICGFMTTAFVYIKLGRVETKVDGKMDELLKVSIGRATAEGIATGEQSQRDRASIPEASTVTIANPPNAPVPVEDIGKPGPSA